MMRFVDEFELGYPEIHQPGIGIVLVPFRQYLDWDTLSFLCIYVSHEAVEVAETVHSITPS